MTDVSEGAMRLSGRSVWTKGNSFLAEAFCAVVALLELVLALRTGTGTLQCCASLRCIALRDASSCDGKSELAHRSPVAVQLQNTTSKHSQCSSNSHACTSQSCSTSWRFDTHTHTHTHTPDPCRGFVERLANSCERGRSPQRVHPALRKCAQRRSESTSTRAIPAECSSSDLKIRAAPQ